MFFLALVASRHQTLKIVKSSFRSINHLSAVCSYEGRTFNSRNVDINSCTTDLQVSRSVFNNNQMTEGCSSNCYGGAIYAKYNPSIMMLHNTFDSCIAGNSGGAVYVVSATLASLTNNTFSNCVSKSTYGGSIFATLTKKIDFCSNKFTNSKGGGGGAIYCHNSNNTLTENIFSDCTSSFFGGAVIIHCQTGSTANSNIESNIFIKSESTKSGGSLIILSGSSILYEVVVNNTFYDSSLTGGDGGALYISQVSSLTFENNKFERCYSHKSSSGKGGALFLDELLLDSCNIINCSFRHCISNISGTLGINANKDQCHYELKGCQFENCTSNDANFLNVKSGAGKIVDLSIKETTFTPGETGKDKYSIFLEAATLNLVDSDFDQSTFFGGIKVTTACSSFKMNSCCFTQTSSNIGSMSNIIESHATMTEITGCNFTGKSHFLVFNGETSMTSCCIFIDGPKISINADLTLDSCVVETQMSPIFNIASTGSVILKTNTNCIKMTFIRTFTGQTSNVKDEKSIQITQFSDSNNKCKNEPFPTHVFSNSLFFTKSAIFSISNKMTETNYLSFSKEMSLTNQLSFSNVFTISDKHSYSEEFAVSKDFSLTLHFTHSKLLSLSNSFEASDQPSKSNSFTHTNDFSVTDDFIKSDVLSNSFIFEPSSELSDSNIFSITADYSLTKDFSLTNQFGHTNEFGATNGFTTSKLFGESKLFSNTGDFFETVSFNSSSNFTESMTFTPVQNENQGDSSKKAGMIAGSVIGAIVLIALIAILIYLFVIRKKRSSDDSDYSDVSSGIDPYGI